MTRRVLLTGATGFIGRAVYTALSHYDGVEVRTLLRQATGPPATRVVRADLAHPRSLRGVCDGVDAVVHAASYVGADPDRCERVNHQGTRRLVEEADRAGVAAFVQVSTAAVYGTGPHRGPDEQCLPPAPESPTSASRAAGERWVLAAGGTVLRPHLVYGVGDRWVIPTLARLLAVLPGWIDGGRALTSVVAVSELARLTAALTLAPTVAGSGGTVLHANHPKPVSIRELGLTVAGLLGLRVPEGTVRRGDVRAHLDGLPVHSRHLDMLAVDHWYDSNRIWRVSGCRPGPDPLGELPASASWYAAALTGATT